MSGLTPQETEANARYLRATLATLVRLDWRDPAVARILAEAAVRRHPVIVAPQADSDRKLILGRAFLADLAAVLRRLDEPDFNLPAHLLAIEAPPAASAEPAAVAAPAPQRPVAVTRPPRLREPAEEVMPPSAGRSRLLAAAAVLAIAVISGTWLVGGTDSPPERTGALPPPEVRLAFARESETGRTLAEVQRDFGAILAANTMRPPVLMPTEDGLFAHAPSAVVLPVAGKSRIQVAFGMRTGAWDNGSPTDGACFRIEAEGAGPIFDQCLDPGAIAPDRRIQIGFAAIPLGTTQLKLITTCKGHCASDWTYWGRIRLE